MPAEAARNRLPPIALPLVLRRDDSGVAWLALNRPAARNPLSVAMTTALDDEPASMAEDFAVRVVAIAAIGPAFCFGHDLREVRAKPDPAFTAAPFAQCSALMTRIVRLPRPAIAQVQGIVAAAGRQLVASCDLAVAAEETRFATPGVNIGLVCSIAARAARAPDRIAPVNPPEPAKDVARQRPGTGVRGERGIPARTPRSGGGGAKP